MVSIFINPFFLLHLILVNYINNSIIFVYLSVISLGIYGPLFWLAYRSEILVNSSRKHMASQIGNLQIIAIFLSSLAPLIGGFLLQEFPYFYSLSICLILLIIGMIPLLVSEDIKIKKHKFPYSRYIKIYKKYKNKPEKLSFASEGIKGVIGLVIFPIFLFIILENNLLYLGSLTTAISIIISIVLYFTKKHIDRQNKSKLLKSLTRIISANWIIKFFFVLLASPIIIFIEGIHKLFENIFTMSYFSIFYNNARKNGNLDYIIFRELMLQTTKLLFSVFCIILLSLFHFEILKFVILLCVISSLLEGMLKEI
jgi:MFS family permease